MWTELAPLEDPNALLFMDIEECGRCRELQDGAPYVEHTMTWKGNVVLDEHRNEIIQEVVFDDC